MTACRDRDSPHQAAFDESAGASQRRDQTAHRGRRIFPNEATIVRHVGATLFEQNDESAEQRARYLTRETIATLGDDPIVNLPDTAA